MFTGIVACTLPVADIDKKQHLYRFSFHLPGELLTGLTLGASVAINGACLTVAAIEGDQVSFDVMMETLRITNLADVSVGDQVNIERAARFGDEIGGHLLSGHIHAVAEVIAIETPANNKKVTFKVSAEVQDYLFEKGYVALNGVSLTLSELKQDCFSVYFIPETLRVTTFGQVIVGEKINLEVDSQTQAVVDTVKRMKDKAAL
ncbi:riboflavin synthase subunit alpha [Spartinivicinus poritis]|uniref:Riboflavin synthase n=1 Tax=Spartinivicinus poritis TaxID=2994640 RepID=A0ABT5UBR6_9GAMM|nr:riboflavin synthase subunit alpha [Spartinivicinus sp. A2-2]MDE1462942.1 riboflavin synthase subunit alpha [Spartinivicinus sp. A2-2]